MSEKFLGVSKYAIFSSFKNDAQICCQQMRVVGPKREANTFTSWNKFLKEPFDQFKHVFTHLTTFQSSYSIFEFWANIWNVQSLLWCKLATLLYTSTWKCLSKCPLQICVKLQSFYKKSRIDQRGSIWRLQHIWGGVDSTFERLRILPFWWIWRMLQIKSPTLILLCKVELGLKQNTLRHFTISNFSRECVVNAKCDLISEFATWLNFEFSINSDLKYIKYSSRNQFSI